MALGTTQRSEWERLKAGGRTRYLLLFGVIGRGIPMAAVFLIVFLYLEGRSFDAALVRDFGVWWRFLLAALLFSVGGVASSYARWRAMELRFESDERGAS
ncbi:MAG: hypothetical protein GWN37_07290 [Gammaproteobacteria bacterium]|nr:hypothetical protein [Gammaproteobacteria bacterium]